MFAHRNLLQFDNSFQACATFFQNMFHCTQFCLRWLSLDENSWKSLWNSQTVDRVSWIWPKLCIEMDWATWFRCVRWYMVFICIRYAFIVWDCVVQLRTICVWLFVGMIISSPFSVTLKVSFSSSSSSSPASSFSLFVVLSFCSLSSSAFHWLNVLRLASASCGTGKGT